jgi:hypothetical protein
MKHFLTIVSLLTAITTPALAATVHLGAAQSSQQLYMSALGATRDGAVRECTAEASKYSDAAWETTKSAVYATCMAEHGQPQ